MLNLYLKLFQRLDLNKFVGWVLTYFQEDTPSKQLTKHKRPDDTKEFLFLNQFKKS